MKKVESIYNLIIEVTRKCNTQCDHCLRGDRENKNIDYKFIDSLLNQVENINSVTFTGGEPSLNVDAIEYFLQQCKEKDIYIGYFFIVTNGININASFVIACLKLYAYCEEKEMCQVLVSNDSYHAYEEKLQY